jgi:phospholipid transport system transporter-binding protein
MTETRVSPCGESGFAIAGTLDFSTVGELLPQGIALLNGAHPHSIALDLSGVTRANSAGLALLLEWLDHARQRNQQLYFTHLPRSIIAIAQTTHCADLLPVQDE